MYEWLLIANLYSNEFTLKERFTTYEECKYVGSVIYNDLKGYYSRGNAINLVHCIKVKRLKND